MLLFWVFPEVLKCFNLVRTALHGELMADTFRGPEMIQNHHAIPLIPRQVRQWEGAHIGARTAKACDSSSHFIQSHGYREICIVTLMFRLEIFKFSVKILKALLREQDN